MNLYNTNNSNEVPERTGSQMRIGPLQCLKSNDYGKNWKKKHKENIVHAKTVEFTFVVKKMSE